ncbi:N-terminal kinase-like protein [Vanrija pseudolonga]|uniref:N-terminal kinase-like protein n=1 Tax=Vanrija pseudolonga TaxID=143232 RepID=A0AAF0Y7M6_9TREE|nr:N-terminal kinase-like protein [Vanrija pseudolonga]
MNYLKSITTSVLNSTGVSFPFSIGERIPGLEAGSTIWDIREGVKKDDGTPLTLFIFDSTLGPLQPGNKDRRTLFQLAKNSLKKLRTIRHPDVLKYIDSVETETHIYIATEQVRPLQGVLRDWERGGALASTSAVKNKEGKEAWLGWGVKSISTALAFLNSPPLSQHHAYLLPSTVFITPAMEWRLAGFDLLTGRDDASGVLWGLGGLAPGGVGEYSSPEVQKGGWGVLRDTDPAQEDIYLLAMFLFHLYNPEKPIPKFSGPPTPASAGSLPKSLFPLWKRMLNPNARTRLSTINFVAEAQSTSFWTGNPLVSLVEGLDGFELRSDGEKQQLLRIIKDAADAGTLPEPFLVHRVLPSLLHSLSLPDAPSALMLPLVLAIGKTVPPSTYPKVVLEPVVKLYASPDRGTRMALLEGLNEYADKLDSRTVNERVWPNLITGFADTVPVIREATIKAVYPLSSKLSDRILNNDLLRLLAKMQQDVEPSIRTNTCILLGRLAPSLNSNTKKKVLVPAFARSLKDTFVHTRVAALMSLMASIDCFDTEDLAARVLPNMTFALVDKEKMVRDQAFKAVGIFLKRVEEGAAQMPDTQLSDEARAPAALGSNPPPAPNGSSSYVNSAAGAAAGAAGSLAGWAFSTLSQQISSRDANSSLTAASSNIGELPNFQAARAAAAAAETKPSPERTPSYERPAAPSKVSSFGAAPKPVRAGSGMKLGGAAKAHKPTDLADALAADFEDDEVANAWGNDDLINVNADDDDWTAFEEAPQEVAAAPPPQSYYVTPAAKPAPKPAPPKPEPVVAPKPVKAAPAVAKSPPPTESARSSISEPSKPSTPQPNLSSLSKEEKDKEMARRREERKARIAAMKGKK